MIIDYYDLIRLKDILNFHYYYIYIIRYIFDLCILTFLHLNLNACKIIYIYDTVSRIF